MYICNNFLTRRLQNRLALSLPSPEKDDEGDNGCENGRHEPGNDDGGESLPVRELRIGG